jgi:hypothetical protein
MENALFGVFIHVLLKVIVSLEGSIFNDKYLKEGVYHASSNSRCV